LGGTGHIRFLHWNVHSWRDTDGGTNTAAVAGLIAETDPDVVSLVEVNEAWGSPGRLKEVADRGGYSWLFVPVLEFGDEDPRTGYGNALLTRLPILAVQQWQLTWPPKLYVRTEASEPRSVVLTRLQLPEGTFWAGALHLPAGDRRARSNTLTRLRTLIAELDEPWLICGDFNTSASSWARNDHSVTVSGKQPTFPTGRPNKPIDYCIASPGWNLDATVLPHRGSDHLPLLVRAERVSLRRRRSGDR
jgi:endonuclease/exonuclease/phosphatase family metal-dependent hydrolase